MNFDEIIGLISKDNGWCKTVFGLQTVTKYNVARFFFQVLATEILTVELLGGKSVALVIDRAPADNFLYNDPVNWKDMKFCKRGRGGAAVPFSILGNSVIQVQRMVEEY